MALAAKTNDTQATTSADTAANMADWFEIYYQDEPANTPAAPASPELSALDQMYAYF